MFSWFLGSRASQAGPGFLVSFLVLAGLGQVYFALETDQLSAESPHGPFQILCLLRQLYWFHQRCGDSVQKAIGKVRACRRIASNGWLLVCLLHVLPSGILNSATSCVFVRHPAPENSLSREREMRGWKWVVGSGPVSGSDIEKGNGVF